MNRKSLVGPPIQRVFIENTSGSHQELLTYVVGPPPSQCGFLEHTPLIVIKKCLSSIQSLLSIQFPVPSTAARRPRGGGGRAVVTLLEKKRMKSEHVRGTPHGDANQV